MNVKDQIASARALAGASSTMSLDRYLDEATKRWNDSTGGPELSTFIAAELLDEISGLRDNYERTSKRLERARELLQSCADYRETQRDFEICGEIDRFLAGEVT